MKTFITLVLLSLSTSILAEAGQQKLVTLTCAGSNGLELTLDSSSNIVKTSLGIMRKDFESNRIVFITEKNGVQLTRISLGKAGAPNIYIYDIYLISAPIKNQNNTLEGVIGQTVYSYVFPAYAAVVPVPVGFIPATRLDCDVLTE